MDQKLDMLGKVPLFAGLQRRDLEQVGRECDEVDLPAGRVIAKQGSWAEEFFIILDGTVDVTRDDKHLADLGPGDFFGEMALLGKIPRTATVTATTAVKVLVLGHREFNSVLASHPSIQSAVLQALASRVATLEPERHH
ncbi:MAG TPA: cyclic nucleotide-binding domain-containing protein [Candidatus Saccharimonadales bacterium]|nr:cyclic nucleotide-binding domain-containing protein [Candidatus Saccharimonadales bacterium]